MSNRRTNRTLASAPNPTPQARHHNVGAITLIPLLLKLLVARQINIFRQWRPFAHPLVGLMQLAIAGHVSSQSM